MRLLHILQKLRDEQADFLDATENLPKLTAKDALIKPVFLYPEDNVKTILRKLRREDVNVCVVVNRDRSFVGKIGDDDIIRLFLQQVMDEQLTRQLDVGYSRTFMYHKAGELVNRHKTTITSDTPINKVIEIIFREDFQYIPVIDRNGRVIGVVTPSSLIDLLQDC